MGLDAPRRSRSTNREMEEMAVRNVERAEWGVFSMLSARERAP